MKTVKKLSTLLAVTAFVYSCSKTNSNNNSVNGQTVVPPVVIDPANPGTGTGGITFKTGSSATFNPVSLDVMNKYVATHPLNNPSNFQININLAQASAGKYGGQVSITYMDNGITYNGVFKSGMGKNASYKGMYDNDRLESDYNYWFKYEKQLVFTGFFEDQYGAITITLVPQNPTGGGNDAEPVIQGTYKGYVYFKNFEVTPAPHSPYRSCWYTYMGPYDCRSNVIQTKCGLFPGAEAGYQLLGTFSNIDVKKAFNIN